MLKEVKNPIELAAIRLYWDDELIPGWFAEVLRGDEKVDDSMRVGFPVEVGEFGPDEGELIAALREAFPGATIQVLHDQSAPREHDPALDHWSKIGPSGGPPMSSEKAAKESARRGPGRPLTPGNEPGKDGCPQLLLRLPPGEMAQVRERGGQAWVKQLIREALKK